MCNRPVHTIYNRGNIQAKLQAKLNLNKYFACLFCLFYYEVQTGTPLARQSLVLAATRDTDVLRFICDIPISTATNYDAGDHAVRAAATFFAVVSVACLQAGKLINVGLFFAWGGGE